MGGLRYESLADMPQGIRNQVAGKLLTEQAHAAAQPKYRNQKETVNGITFDSRKEARRYQQLLVWQEKGAICDLRLQEDFTLRESFVTSQGERIRAIRYRADFTYCVDAKWFYALPENFIFQDQDLIYWKRLILKREHINRVVEDVKSRGTKTKEYRMKYKLMAEKGYQIREV